MLLYFCAEKDLKKLGQVTEDLYSLLQKENLLGRNCKQRTTILKSIFKLLDADDTRIQLKLARLILAVSNHEIKVLTQD